jgi:hypothetical protein
MTIAQTSSNESVREALNRADPNVLADMLRSIAFGDALRGMPVYLRGRTPVAAYPQQVSTLSAIQLPQDAKAAILHRVTVRTATAAAGEFTIVAYGTTPTTTQAAIAPNGDIVFLTSDAVTSVDVIYTPQKGDVLGNQANSKLGITSLTLAAPAGVATIPAPYSGLAILLLQANATVATFTGQKQILVPATTNTATLTAALSKDGTKVYFNSATDVVTQCQVDLLVASGLVSTTQIPGAQLTGASAQTTDLNSILEQANGGAVPNTALFT